MQLQFISISDPIFSVDRFRKVPVTFLSDCVNYISKAKREQVNAASVTNAKLAMLVLGALGGKSAKAKLQDFLPYEMDQFKNGLNSTTIDALKWALKNEKMPASIVGLIGAELR